MIVRLLGEVALASGVIGYLTHLVVKRVLSIRQERLHQRKQT